MKPDNVYPVYGPNWNLERYRYEKPPLMIRDDWRVVVATNQVNTTMLGEQHLLVHMTLEENKPIPKQADDHRARNIVAVFTMRDHASTWRAIYPNWTFDHYVAWLKSVKDYSAGENVEALRASVIGPGVIVSK